MVLLLIIILVYYTMTHVRQNTEGPDHGLSWTHIESDAKFYWVAVKQMLNVDVVEGESFVGYTNWWQGHI